MSDDVHEKLRLAVEKLAKVVAGGDRKKATRRVLLRRSARLAERPVDPGVIGSKRAYLVFERSARRYAVALEALREVTPLGAVASVPGVPPIYLGVAARKGRILAVIDLPRLFASTVEAGEAPRWGVVVYADTGACVLAADAIHDLLDVDEDAVSPAMPTWPELAQRHTIGVLEQRTVLFDVVGLLGESSLRVDDRS